jgi:hypothetical protein
MGDGDYMFAFQQLVMPIAIEFDPDLVIGQSALSALFSFAPFLCHATIKKPSNMWL